MEEKSEEVNEQEYMEVVKRIFRFEFDVNKVQLTSHHFTEVDP